LRHPLDYFLNPASVAVIGASTVPHKAGGRRWRSLVEAGFPGPLYPIHPGAKEILGHRAYPSLHDVPDPVELAVVLVRTELVPAAIADCVALKVPAIVVITAGFGETGPEGRRLEEEMTRTVRAAGSRLIGPNCAGLFSASGGVNVLGWGAPAGPIALVSQSGNVALTFVQFAREKGLGFSRLITVGNAADLRLPEYADYLLTDPETRAIVMYLEGFQPGEGRALYELLRGRSAAKPIIVLKPGKTEGGRRAALSHTGALAGEDRIVDAALRQAGILRVSEAEEAWDVAIAVASLPPMRTGSVVVVSDGGGHATIVCDAANRLGLAVPCLSEATRTALGKLLPARSAVINPVDFAGLAEEEPEVIPRVLDVCLGDASLGGVILAGHFGGYVKIATEELGRREVAAAAEIAEVVRRHGKPLVVHTIYGGERLPALEVLRGAGIPVYRSLEASAKALAGAWRWACARRPTASPARRSRPDRSRVASVLARAQVQAGGVLLEPDARELLALYGLPVPPFRVAATPEEAARAAEELGGEVALKLVGQGVVHKTEIGGVLLDVAGALASRAGFKTLGDRAEAAGVTDARVLVTPMIAGGVEVVVGLLRDPQFGAVVMFGLGGVLVEALEDVVFRLAPLDADEARAMIGEIRGVRLLRGFRGRPPVDVAAAVDLVVRVSELAADWPEIAEVDVNPVFLLPQAAAVADARVVVAIG